MAEPPKPIEWNYCPTCGTGLAPKMDGEKHRPYCRTCERFFYSNPTPAVCCFVAQGDTLLLAQRAIEPCMGMWALPGGFIELGETTEEAAIREMREETSLEVKRLELLGVSTQQSRYYGAVTVLGYLVHEWEGDPKPDSDALDLRFFATHERPPLPFTAHVELVRMYDALRGSL